MCAGLCEEQQARVAEEQRASGKVRERKIREGRYRTRVWL